MTIAFAKSLSVLALGVGVFGGIAAPAFATSLARTWVSHAGTDSGTCGAVTAPCATFAGALANTMTGGEIDALDSGDYATGSLTITKSITINGNGAIAGITVSNGNGINVNAATTSQVNLIGLDLIGTGGGDAGIYVTQAAQVHVHNCQIRNFFYGVYAGALTAPTLTLVTDTVFDDNQNALVAITGAQLARLSVDHAIVNGVGMSFSDTGIEASGANSVVTVNNSTVVATGTGFSAGAGSFFYSFGNNRVSMNGTNGQANQPALTTK